MEWETSNSRDMGKDILHEDFCKPNVFTISKDAVNTFDFEAMVKTILPTQDAFYELYNKYAKAHGFSIRKDRIKINSENVVYHRIFVCSREGKRDEKYNNIEHRVRTERAISRCFCLAKLEIKYHAGARMWYVSNFIDEHSHPLASSREVPFLRSHRKLTDTDKKDIEILLKARVRKFKIMDLREVENNGFNNIGYIATDLYNHCQRERSKKIDLGDAQTVLNSFKVRKMKDPGFFYCYDKDAEGRLSHLFWADEQSRVDYFYYGDVLIFDSTFRTNKYKMPFIPFIGVNNHRRTTFFGCGLIAQENTQDYIWLLTAFLTSVYQKHPISVVTDGDSAMRNAIVQIFPNSTHRLCCWHIKKNLPRNIRFREARNAFKRLMFRQMTPHEFDERWKKFSVSVGANHQWSNRMYATRHLWSETFFKGHKLLGIRSSQRSESANALLQKHFDRNMLLQDLLCHYEICVARNRSSEARDDAKATQTRPYVPETAHRYEVEASNLYTPNNFALFQLNFIGSNRYKIVSTEKFEMYVDYMVADESKGADFEIVHFPLDSLQPLITCSCMNMESRGIPCSHMLRCLVERNLPHLPSTLIWDRWTINCRFSVLLDEFPLYEADAISLKYEDLIKLGKKLFLQVVKDDEAYLEVRNWLSGCLNERFKWLAHNIAAEDKISEEIAEAFEHNDKVHEPVYSKCKGAPRTRLKSWNERRPYSCTNCRGDNHNARTCPFNDGHDSEDDSRSDNLVSTLKGVYHPKRSKVAIKCSSSGDAVLDHASD